MPSALHNRHFKFLRGQMFTTEHLPDCFLLLWVCEPIPLPGQLEDVRACSVSVFCDNLLLLFMLSRHHFPHPQNLSCVIFTQNLWKGKKCKSLKYPAQKHCSSSLEKSLAHLYWEEAWAATRREALTGCGSTRKADSSEIHSLTSFLSLKSLLQAQQEVQRAQVLAHPNAGVIPFPLDIWRYWTFCPVLNSEHFSAETPNNLWGLPKLQLFVWIKNCCCEQKSPTQPTSDETVLVTCGSC